MRQIELKNRHDETIAVALVDDADYASLSRWTWRLSKSARGSGYARRYERTGIGTKKAILMHREILNVPSDLDTDHRDGNGLNNQRHNIRAATTSQNMWNRGKSRNGKDSVYKGVSLFRGDGYDYSRPWVAQICSGNKHTYIGYFSNEAAAAMAYDRAAYQLHGDFAYQNFPVELSCS